MAWKNSGILLRARRKIEAFGCAGKEIDNIKLVNVQQLSEMLNVKPKTIYGWTHKEKIPCYKLECSLRFNLDEIQKWIKSKKHKVRGRVGIL